MPRPLSISSNLQDAVTSDLLAVNDFQTPPRRSQSEQQIPLTSSLQRQPQAGPSIEDAIPLDEHEQGLSGDESDDSLSQYGSADEEIYQPAATRPASLRSIGSGKSSFAIRIQENNDVVGFLSQCTISSFFSVQAGKPGGHVVYELELMLSQGTTIRTLKRYSDFVRLRKALLRELPKNRYRDAVVPKLPPKHLKKFKQELLERRRQTLAFWLQTVLMHPDLGSHPIVKQWLLDS